MRFFRATDGARTRGLDLGKVARYQLRHCRISVVCYQRQVIIYSIEIVLSTQNYKKIGKIKNGFWCNIGRQTFIKWNKENGLGVPMSAKTKIVVLHMKELIYTVIFAVLAILLIILFVFMFGQEKKDESVETMKYTPGKYTSSIVFNDNTIDVEVVVDENSIQSVSLVNLDESVATMYPLMQPALDSISEQIYEKQSLTDVDYGTENQYTSAVLLDAIKDAVKKAEVTEE